MNDEEKRTCKTCVDFNDEVYYCRKHDTAMAEWDSCEDHTTWEEDQKWGAEFYAKLPYCRNHGKQKSDYKYCPYCGSILLTPINSDTDGSKELRRNEA